MTAPAPGLLTLEPVVSWPRDAVVGQPYLVEVDLRIPGDPPPWPYDEEEMSLLCLLGGSVELRVEALGPPTVVVHRFGGSYGAARYLVTPQRVADQVRLFLTVATRRGVPVRTEALPLRVRPARSRDTERADTTRAPGPVEPGVAGAPIISVILQGDALFVDRVFVSTRVSVAGLQRAVAQEDESLPLADLGTTVGRHIERAVAEAGVDVPSEVRFLVTDRAHAGIPFERFEFGDGLRSREIGTVCPVTVSLVRRAGREGRRPGAIRVGADWIEQVDAETDPSVLAARTATNEVVRCFAIVGGAEAGRLPTAVAVVLAYAGEAMVLWCREPRVRAEFEEFVAELSASRPEVLAQRVAGLRGRGNLLGRSLTVFTPAPDWGEVFPPFRAPARA